MDTPGIWRVEARDTAKHPTRHRTAPAKQRIIQSATSVVLPLRNPGIDSKHIMG